jgi:BolA family transcriptional regulator, general stress-responsive regulator
MKTDRINSIYQRLREAFQPIYLDVIDESDKHRGHVGSQEGAGHYTVIISSECFKSTSRVDRHREIYAVLNDFIPHDIHALKIKFKSIF